MILSGGLAKQTAKGQASNHCHAESVTYELRFPLQRVQLESREELFKPLEANFQMLCQTIHFGRVHLHFVAQGIPLQLKSTGRCYHARIICDHFAHKMDTAHSFQRFDRPDQNLTPADLGADQFQLAAFESAEEPALPV